MKVVKYKRTEEISSRIIPKTINSPNIDYGVLQGTSGAPCNQYKGVEAMSGLCYHKI